MATRMSAVMALIVFAVCLAAGIGADNPLATILWHALQGMGATLVIGLIVGAMAQKMLDENLKSGKKVNESADAPSSGAPAAAPAGGRRKV